MRTARGEEARTKLDLLTRCELDGNVLGQAYLPLLGGIRQTAKSSGTNSCCTCQPRKLAMIAVRRKNQGVETRTCNASPLAKKDLIHIIRYILWLFPNSVHLLS